eukprot:m.74578 g.74578  ORF g.74578 m.74578 type:complete len:292 (+) comp14517_c0_seq1:200-1075(+)
MMASRRLPLLLGVLAMLLAAASAEVTVTVGTEQHTFPSREADFGPNLPSHGLMGVLQVAEPLDACSDIQPPRVNDSNFIALIQRGGIGTNPPCQFDAKVLAAQKAGFIAAIVFDNVDEDLLTMASTIDGVGISSVFVSLSAGTELKQLEGQVARLTPDPRLQWPSYIVSFAVITSAAFLILSFVLLYRRCYMRRRTVATVVVDSSQISKLPTRVVAGPVNPDPHSREICCICLEEHAVGDVLTILPCKHAFHKRCIEPWLLQSHRSCPICKRDPCASEPSPSERTPLIDSV